MKKKTAAVLGVVWLLVMVGIIASTGTLLLSGKTSGDVHWVSDDEYAIIERYARLETVRKTLMDGYYQEVDDQQLMTGAVRGMMASLEDPYTFYYSTEEMTRRNDEVEGGYHGLGILLQNNADGEIEVLRVYEDSPADKAGVAVGDRILKVNGIRVSGETSKDLNDAVERMKGEDGTEISLELRRGSEIRSINAVRDEISVSNVRSSIIDGDIGYISIYQFVGDASEAFASALEALREAEVGGLIVDLRNNPGGILDQVVGAADLLLDKGTIVYTEDRAGSRSDYYSDENHWDVPLVVLVNDMSASASEIFAAAVQDCRRGTVLGTPTYGKGIVQTVLSFEDVGDGMQYTSACYYTTNGRSIHGIGVTPDILVEADEGFAAYSGEPDLNRDVQLRAALSHLRTNAE